MPPRGDAGRRGSREAQAAAFPVVRHAPDYGLFAVVAMLLVLGLVAVYSSSYALGFAQFDDANYFIKRQAVWAALGALGLLFTMNLNYHLLRRLAPLLMIAAIAGLVAVLVPGIGVEQNGAQRWVGIGPLVGQPSEFAKLAVLIYLAAWLAAKGEQVKDLALGVFPFIFMVGLVGALIMLEPDLGTAMMVGVITGSLFFVAGARLKHLLVLAATTVSMGGVLILTAGYRMDRILSFTSAEADPSGLGFHTLQLLIAFGSGGWTGLGLGVSRQKFFFVPGSHTDGILAIIGEELGFVGVMAVLLLFALLLWRGMMIARRAPDTFGALLATGIVAWFGFQTLINVGGVTRMIPLTGIPLPLISAGGSALATMLVAVGVLLSVSRYTVQAPVLEEAAPRGVVRSAAVGGAR